MISEAIIGTLSLFLLILVITQIIIPAFAGLPIFWLFSATGRARVEFAIRSVTTDEPEDKTKPKSK